MYFLIEGMVSYHATLFNKGEIKPLSIKKGVHFVGSQSKIGTGTKLQLSSLLTRVKCVYRVFSRHGREYSVIWRHIPFSQNQNKRRPGKYPSSAFVTYFRRNTIQKTQRIKMKFKFKEENTFGMYYNETKQQLLVRWRGKNIKIMAFSAVKLKVSLISQLSGNGQLSNRQIISWWLILICSFYFALVFGKFCQTIYK